MAKGGKLIPVGLKKVEKGRHSEKPSHKSDWFQSMIFVGSSWVGGPKKTQPWQPPCVPASKPWPFQ